MMISTPTIDHSAELDRRCGLIGIVGRANVGKSTYINAAIGHKLSITSHKPQTTRHRLLGIHTCGAAQLVYVDTPGFQLRPRRQLNRSMNRTAQGVLADVDVLVLMVEACRWEPEDEAICTRAIETGRPVLLAVNKIDRLARKDALLPYLQAVTDKGEFAEVVPISAARAVNLDRLQACIIEHLPSGPFLFPEDQLTDVNERFICSEILREKLMRSLAAELPYSISVVIEEFSDEPALLRIGASIWVEKNSQKGIVIGAGGKKLKAMASQARRDLEAFFGRKVYLNVWVKVKEHWADDAGALKELGFET